MLSPRRRQPIVRTQSILGVEEEVREEKEGKRMTIGVITLDVG